MYFIYILYMYIQAPPGRGAVQPALG